MRYIPTAKEPGKRRYYPLTAICVILIFVLSFFTPPQTALDDIAYIDKWTHLVMYGGTIGVFWIEYWHYHIKHHVWCPQCTLIFLTIIIGSSLGGIIEILQAYCTNGRRSGEWLDWIADTLGVVIATALGATIIKRIAHRIWGPAPLK